MIIPTALRGTDITIILSKEDYDGSILTGAEHQARNDNFMAHFYGMLDLHLHIGGRSDTSKDRAH